MKLRSFGKQPFLRSPRKKQAGVTMIEYALIAALVAVAAVVILGTLGNNITATFTTVAGKLAG